jgi:hypothetical protein
MVKTAGRKNRWLAVVVAVVMVFAMFAATGAAPQSEAHAAVGDSLTVSAPGASDGDRLFLYIKQGNQWVEPDYTNTPVYPYQATVTKGIAVFSNFNDADIGSTATILWESFNSASQNVYGQSQVLGGWVGDVNDKGANPATFILSHGQSAFPFNLAATATVTVNISPPPSDNVFTWVYAYPVANSYPGYSIQGGSISPIIDGATAANGGLATFKLKPGVKYAFEAGGERVQGATATQLPNTWYGGYQGNFTNNSKLKIVKVGKAGSQKNLGLIRITPLQGKISGTAAKGDLVSAYNPVTRIAYSTYADDTTGKYLINAEPGVYLVDSESDNRIQAVPVKQGKTAKASFGSKQYTYWNGDLSIKVKGTVKKGAKLKASAKAYNVSPKSKSKMKYKYIWTDGTKRLGTSATYKVSKAVAKSSKRLFVIVIGTRDNYSEYSYYLVR